MTIKHFVISGGGVLGLRYLGILEKLNINKYWNITDIETIYSTSIGSMMGAFICLNYEWDILKKYIIERPWQDVFKLTGQQIFNSYTKKGLYDKTLMEMIFKPLLQAKDLSLNITLKEFYEYSKIHLYLFTFNINKFETVELSYTTHPNLSLIQAITMSCSLPGLFMPTIIGDDCFIDGGIMNNLPINECLRDHPNKNEILAINRCYSSNINDIFITEDTHLLDYITYIALNTMKFVSTSIKREIIDNTIICYTDTNPMSFFSISETVLRQEFRVNLLKQGEEDADKFLLSLNA